jgi:hypothetical protein
MIKALTETRGKQAIMTTGMQVIFYFSILFLVIQVILMGKRYNSHLLKVLPVCLCLFTGCLYLLAFFRAVEWVLLIQALAIGAELLYIWRNDRNYADTGVYIRTELSRSSLWVFGITTVLAIIILRWSSFNNGDDMNFWGIDIKSVYELHGFAQYRRNAALKYGDYPPAMQLVSAWSAYALPGFHENIAITGRCIFLITFIISGFESFISKNRKLVAVWALFVLSALCLMGTEVYTGAMIEAPMAIVFGCILVEMTDTGEDGNRIGMLRMIAYLSFLVLMKSVGIFWVMLAVVYYMMHGILIKRVNFRVVIHECSIMFGIPMLIYCTWVMFCFLMKRSTYLTKELVNAVSSGAVENESKIKIACTFMKVVTGQGFFRGVSYLMMMMILFLAFWVLIRQTGKGEHKARWMAGYVLLACIVTFIYLLCGYLYIFSGEANTSYDVHHMNNTFMRYSLPLWKGLIFVIVYMLLKYAKNRKVFAGTIAATVLLANPFAIDRTLPDRADYSNIMNERNEMNSSAEMNMLAGQISECDTRDAGRILYFKADSWTIPNTYDYKIAPFSLTFFHYDEMNQDILNQYVIQKHNCQYIYTDCMDEKKLKIFDQYMSGGERFKSKTLYNIDFIDGKPVFREADTQKASDNV